MAFFFIPDYLTIFAPKSERMELLDGKETARIIESPNTDLETDLAQIALGFPSNPNYRGATRMIELIEEKSSRLFFLTFPCAVANTILKLSPASTTGNVITLAPPPTNTVAPD